MHVYCIQLSFNDLYPGRMAQIIREQVQDLRRPPEALGRVLGKLDNFAPTFVRYVRLHIEEEDKD